MIRYYFGSTRYTDKNGKVKYKTFKKDEYPDIGWIKDPKNAYERQVNKKAETLLDQMIEAKNVDLRRGKLGMITEVSKKANMIDDFKNYFQKKYTKKNTISGHISLLSHLTNFAGKLVPYSNVTPQFCKAFLDYLESLEYVRGRLNKNTSKSYFNAFKVFLGEMKQQGKILVYPAEDIKAKGEPHKQKDYLTKQEVQILINTDIRASRSLKPFFLFSCLTGQAHEECRLMTWDMLEEQDGRFYLKAQRQKTGQFYRIPINKQSMKVIGERPKNRRDKRYNKVFPTLKYSHQQNQLLQEWVDKAGILKKVTPHVGRHTFSAMYYKQNKDIGGLMNILNHKDISTTQRYLAGLLGGDYFVDKDVDIPEFEI
ncbi:MAG: hypothetical protein CMC81_06010 [Flavobacteriaceae bacterium]|nr:hypothetical protein [Flavobacteriaceae bacterium]